MGGGKERKGKAGLGVVRFGRMGLPDGMYTGHDRWYFNFHDH